MTDAAPTGLSGDLRAELDDARDRAGKLQRRLDAVQALLAEERAQAAEQAAGRTGHPSEFGEAAALRDELEALRAELRAAQKELRAIRASSTWRAGLAVKRVAGPAAAARRQALRAAKRLRAGGRA